MEDWDLACPDWWARIKSGRLPIRDNLPLNVQLADRAAAIFMRLRLADVPGTPTAGEAGGEWFAETLRASFGSIDPETHSRHLREGFWLVPKKNAKTTFGALGMVTAVLLNERPRANFIMTAPVQDTAQLAFDAAAGAIELDPVLDRKFHIRHHLKRIVHRETKAELEIMTFDPSVLTGVKVSGGALIDELHICSKKAKAAQAIRQIRGGMLPFPEAFLWFITTQSEEEPSGVFVEELQKAREIRDGERRGRMLPVIFEFPKSIQESQDRAWKNPDLWPLLNPNLGKAITLTDMREQFQDAVDKSEADLCSWASQHLNIQIGVAQRSNNWAGALFWEGCGNPKLTLEAILKRCDVVTAGVDGGGLDDLLGLSILGREKATGKWLHWAHAWAHPIVLERRKSEAPRLLDFEKAGELTLVESIGDDVEGVAAILKQCEDAGLLERIGVDPAGIGSIVDAILAIGVTIERIVSIPQGWKMVGAIKTTERKLAEGEIEHCDTGLMAWCVGNARVEPRGNAVIITKQTAGSAKIDPLMATFNAVTLMSLNPAPKHALQMFLVG